MGEGIIWRFLEDRLEIISHDKKHVHNFLTIFFHNLDCYWPSKSQIFGVFLIFRVISTAQTRQIIFFLFIIFSQYPYEHFDTNILKIGRKLSSQEFLCLSELTENLKNTIKYRNINFVIEVSTRANFKDNFILIINKK